MKLQTMLQPLSLKATTANSDRRGCVKVSKVPEINKDSVSVGQTDSIVAKKDDGFRALIENNLYLVRAIVGRVIQKLPSYIEADDLYSVGLTGLVAAARNCHDFKKESFPGYAAIRIRGAIMDELRRKDSLSRGARTKAKCLDIAISKLEQEFHGRVNQESICHELNITSDELAELVEEVRPVNLVSLDYAGEEDGATSQTLHESIADDTCITALDALDRKEVISLLAQRMAQLPDVQRKVLAMSYYENMKLSEIAAAYGLTGSRICQIRSEAVNSLRKYLVSMLS